MRCKYCGAVFHDEGLKYCPYCENDIEIVQDVSNLSKYERERRARVAPKVPEDAKWGELHFTLLKGRGGLSPADGSHYFIIVDEYYETEIISENNNKEVVIKLPYGDHVLKVRMFPYNDDDFSKEATYARQDNIKFTIGDNPVQMELDQGTLFKSAKINIIQ